MTRSDKQMKVDFINKDKKVITKEVNAKEKEILRWTILNYEALVNKEQMLPYKTCTLKLNKK